MRKLNRNILGLLGTASLLWIAAPAQAATSGYVTGKGDDRPVVNLKKVGKKTCKQCGTISDIQAVEDKGKGSGLGVVGGAVIGGVLGHQIGSGRGNTLATVGGAVAGGVAGNEVEKNVKKTKHWDVRVTMDDKSTTEIRFSDEPSFAAGDRVQVTYTKQQASE